MTTWAVSVLLVLGATTGGAPRAMDFGSGDGWTGNAVCYGPHRDGQRPGGSAPTAAQLAEDLRLMAPWWSVMRIYGASEFAETLLEAITAEDHPMQVVLGVWIGPDSDADREIEAAIRLANAYPHIVSAVCVGNETQVSWSAHRIPIDDLIAAVRRVRPAVEQPVTVADDYNFWNKPESRAVVAEIDFVTMHAHPMWNGVQLDDALTWLEEKLAEVETLHPQATVILGETGWATSVAGHGEQADLIRGRPGEAEQARLFTALRLWARTHQRPTFWFEAFDENWKGGDDPAEVEKHWGVFRADRTPKAAVD